MVPLAALLARSLALRIVIVKDGHAPTRPWTVRVHITARDRCAAPSGLDGVTGHRTEFGSGCLGSQPRCHHVSGGGGGVAHDGAQPRWRFAVAQSWVRIPRGRGAGVWIDGTVPAAAPSSGTTPATGRSLPRGAPAAARALWPWDGTRLGPAGRPGRSPLGARPPHRGGPVAPACAIGPRRVNSESPGRRERR